MNKLTKLTINKFRNVAPTTLEFRPGINVVLGKNAAGKTTLLRLLATVMGAQDESLEDDVFDVGCHASGPVLDFERTLVRKIDQRPTLPFSVGRYDVLEEPILRQEEIFVFKKGMDVLRARVLPKSVVLELDGELSAEPKTLDRILARNATVSLIYALFVNNENSGLEGFRGAVTTAITPAAGRMDESLEWFRHLLAFDMRIKEGSTGNFRFILDGLLPASFLSVLDEGLFVEGNVATFSLSFLDRAAHALGYDSATARMDKEHLVAGADQKSVRLSNLRFFFKRLNEEISHELLSYGQKRLLAFFAHIDRSEDTLIVDELVNGLHHEWIVACLEAIAGRQAFLTSQNPLLLDFLRFDSAEEVRRAFVFCERIKDEAGDQLLWRNPTEDEADSFFSAYQTGMQRVSDILLTKGLW